MNRIVTGFIVAVMLAAMLPTAARAEGLLPNTLTFILDSVTATYGDDAIDISAFASGQSSSPITFASNTPTVCQTAGEFGGTVEIRGAGECSITASQEGDSSYEAATPWPSTFTVDRADADCSSIAGYTADYDGTTHTATGTCTGVDSEILAGLDLSGTTHLNAGTYADPWAFADQTGNYNPASGAVDDSIAAAEPSCSITGYAKDYDGAAHAATGACLALDGVTALDGLDLSRTTHTDAGTYAADPWTFTDPDGNYTSDSGTVNDTIATAEPSCTVTGYSVTYDGLPHAAVGTCTGVGAVVLEGLNVSGTNHTTAGAHAADPWSFTDPDGNYNPASGTVSDSIAKAEPSCTVTGYSVTYDGSPHTALGTCTGVGGAVLSGLDTSATTHTAAGSYPDDQWTFTDPSGNHNGAVGAVSDSIASASGTLGFDVSGVSATYGDAPFSLATYTTPGPSTSPVTYDSQTTSTCTVTGATLTLVGAGLCTIIASQAGDGSHDDATPVPSSFTIAPASGTLGFDVSGVSATYGDAPFSLATYTTPGPSTSPVTYASQTTSMCTVAGATLTIVAPGLCSIIASQAGDANHLAAPELTSNFTVDKAAADCGSITGYAEDFDGAPHTATGACLALDGITELPGLDLSATTHTNPGTWASDPWTFTDVTGNYRDAVGAVSDSIASASGTLGFDVSGVSATYGDAPFSLATYTTPGPSTSPVTYDSQTTSTCTVTGATLTLVGAGLCTIIASQAGDGSHDDATPVTDTFTVAKAAQTITFTSTPLTPVHIGDVYQVEAIASSGGPVAFSVDATTASVCSISGPAQVQFLARGTCIVVARQDGDANHLAGVNQEAITVADRVPACPGSSVTTIMNVAVSGAVVCTDADGDPLTYAVASQASLGSAVIDSTGHWTYTPSADVTGLDSFTFAANDAFVSSAPATVGVSVVNRPVRARQDAVTVSAVVPTTINVLANDLAGYDTSAGLTEQDPGQPLTITAVTQGGLGTVTVSGGAVVYDPKGCLTGSDWFGYTISDGLTSGTGYVPVTIGLPGQGGLPLTPVAETPSLAFALGRQIAATVPMKVAWCGVTATSKRTYRVLQSSNGGATFPTMLYPTTTLTSTIRPLAVGAAYAWRVRAVDAAGRVGQYVTSPASRVGRYEDSSTAIAFSAGWHVARSSTYSGGTERYATSTAATATLTLPTGSRAFAVVASRASARGRFKVWVDGVLVATISQKSSTPTTRLVLYSGSVTASASHVVVIRPAGTGRIDIDTVLTLR